MKKGFTLVELLVAMALSAIIGVLAYGFFGVTSDSLGEVDSLTEANNQARFAIENLRGVLQMAGSGGTPDGNADPTHQPRIGGELVVQGIVMPMNSDDNRGPSVPAVRGEILAANPSSTFDSFIVMGTYDFPESFEVSGPQSDSNVFRLMGHHRGAQKLFKTDPFDPSLVLEDWGDAATYDPYIGAWESRVLRVMDRDQRKQYLRLPTPLDTGNIGFDGTFDFISFSTGIADAPDGPRFKNVPKANDPVWPDVSQTETGLEPTSDDDLGYPAALIDAYWIHVIPNPQRPERMILVRDRLCASLLAAQLESSCNAPGPIGTPGATCNTASIDPELVRADNNNCGDASQQRVVLAENIADFQVWFDCGDTRGAIVANTTYTRSWNAPAHRNCVDPTDATVGRARVGHVRLSVHAENERPNLRHIMFENDTGHCQPSSTFSPSTTAPPAPAVCEDATLKTFDFQPRLVGSAPVVTMQADVELVNFSYRNF